MNEQSLEAVAKQLVAKGKGILAADEGFPSIEKRFKSIGLPSTVETRRAYREMLLGSDGITDYISGAILFDETIRQTDSDGTPFVDVLRGQGIIPGIKVDKGTVPLPFAPGELTAEGLDGLRERLAEYRELGARFAKWRVAIVIGEGIPSAFCVESNAHLLARYAALCQEAGLLPIVEPEVEMNGAHSIERCFEVTEFTLRHLFDALYEQRVAPERLILKANMVVPGKNHSRQASHDEVADATIRCFQRSVPAAVPGIVFLSGGQSEQEATANLNAMHRTGGALPWPLSFSFGRALQSSPLKIWLGEAGNVPEARRAFVHRAKLNSAALHGRYAAEMEQEFQAA